MKKTTFLFSIILAAIISAAFYFQSEKPIVNPTDYEVYLKKENLEKEISKRSGEINFWQNKLINTPDNFVYEKKLAGLFANRFKLSGEPHDLFLSDSLFKNINQRIPGQVGILQSLTANAITQHKFREAEKYIKQAYEIGEKRFISSLMFVDVLLERGQIFSADQYLRDIAAGYHFDYLIRDVKFQDQKGDLEKAIQQMEKALSIAKASGNEDIINWSLSNLADMYGHDGRIKKSYDTYLEALSHNPADLHSIKGIAWVAFSHEKNTAEAKRILNFLKSIHPVPDYDLLLAEIATFENDEKLAVQYQQQFITKASKSIYGNMYKSYICELTSDTPNAVAIAKAEIEERPHPMSYDLLAWANFQNGNFKKALEITENHVLQKTSEPVALYHSGIILKAASQFEKAEKYLDEALEAAYELGPVVAQEIEQHLEQIDRKWVASFNPQDFFNFNSMNEMRSLSFKP